MVMTTTNATLVAALNAKNNQDQDFSKIVARFEHRQKEKQDFFYFYQTHCHLLKLFRIDTSHNSIIQESFKNGLS